MLCFSFLCGKIVVNKNGGLRRMIKIAICDDNKYALEMMKEYIDLSFRKYKMRYKIYCFMNGERLLNDISFQKFDVVFLDIDMPGIDGFEIARKMNEGNYKCFIIFITNYSELVFRSFDFQPFHFIKKDPIGKLPEGIDHVVKKLISNMKQKQIIELTDNDSMRHIIVMENIVYIKSKGHYLCYCLKDKSVITIRESISVIEQKYREYGFARIHRSIIINMKYVKSANFKFGKLILCCNKEKIPLSISKTYCDQFEANYEEYLRSII